MLMQMRKKFKNQKGFTLIELLVVISIIGVLAAVAVPKFTNATAQATTAKIAADLASLDSAISMHQTMLGTDPANIAALVTQGYIATAPAVPTGSFRVAGATTAITATAYTLNGAGAAMRAQFQGNNAEFYH